MVVWVFDCLAYIPAAALIIVAAMFRKLADLPGRCCWPAAGQWDDQGGQAAGDAGRAAVWGVLASAWLLRLSMG